MPLLKLESEFDDVRTPEGIVKREHITLYLGKADFGDVCQITQSSPERAWRWQTDFSGTVETEDGADVEGPFGSRGFTATREEAIQVLEQKAQRFMKWIGVADAEQRAAERQLLQMLKYFGDGSRWWRRTDGKCPNWLAFAVSKFEKRFGEIYEAENDDVMELVRELEKRQGQALLGDE